MALTGLEREFLKRLFAEPWAKLSHPLGDAGNVQTETLPTGSVQYEITEAGNRGPLNLG